MRGIVARGPFWEGPKHLLSESRLFSYRGRTNERKEGRGKKTLRIFEKGAELFARPLTLGKKKTPEVLRCVLIFRESCLNAG